MSQQKQDRDDTPAIGQSAATSTLRAAPASSSSSSPSPPQPSQPFTAAAYSNDGKKHLLLGASGSVATIKLGNIVRALSRHGRLSIGLVLTESATRFLEGQSDEQPPLSSLLEIPNVDYVFRDEDEWRPAWRRGASILHIELRRWADVLVIAPLSANSLAKIVAGFADNLLLSVVRAWDTTGTGEAATTESSRGTADTAAPARQAIKRIVVAPAMNTAMWTHPVTEKQIRVLEDEWGVDRGGGNSSSNGNGISGSRSSDDPSYPSRTDAMVRTGWFKVLRPERKMLACGDVGDGAMREWTEIVLEIEQELGLV